MFGDMEVSLKEYGVHMGHSGLLLPKTRLRIGDIEANINFISSMIDGSDQFTKEDLIILLEHLDGSLCDLILHLQDPGEFPGEQMWEKLFAAWQSIKHPRGNRSN